MGCTSCGDKPTNTAKDFTKAVIEINNPETLVLLRKVVIPASVSEADNPPAIGKYRNVILKYEDTGNVYLYSSDGIPTAIEANVPQEILDKIANLEGDIDDVSTALSNETTARESADSAIQGDIDAIEEKIPSQASSQNQLADKAFVNSSIATNTANYISDNGQPFQSLAALEAYSGTLTNNDYAFVVGTDQAGNTTYTRYKYVASAGEWAEEYVLNNSSFTAVQWAAINSNITSGAVDKLNNLANIQSVGANLSLVNGELSATDTTYSPFTGTDGTTVGTAGLVPAPTTADAGKVLGANGAWVTGGPTVVQNKGNSTTDVMSQAATTSLVYADTRPYHYGSLIRIGYGASNTSSITSEGIAIGENSNTTGNYGIALGTYAWSEAACGIAIGGGAGTGEGPRVRGAHSIAIGDHIDIESQAGYSTVVGAYGRVYRNCGAIALGAFSEATSKGEMNIGLPRATATQQTTYGYNGSEYRLLSGLYDPQSAHDAATKGYVDPSTDTTAPTSSTTGRLGEIRIDTSTNTAYMCVSADNTTSTYVWKQITA